MFDRVDRELQLVGDLRIAEASAEAMEHVLFTNAEPIRQWARAGAVVVVVLQHPCDQWIEMAAIAVHRLQNAE